MQHNFRQHHGYYTQQENNLQIQKETKIHFYPLKLLTIFYIFFNTDY